ncbi:carbon-nitrogen hydrolase family protein [Glycomyces luteolus]|uniref:Carbon-nitrogen hydrolase family protein n=1 Tax=Glycomyces luteolus TaxID=2670330 RepID=A0A9X3P7D1_9ACTN|nr:carbon-nitrogen hydrolase family protein [Glycomyces luteolus]MDA1358981.1 carbon-nitrogen hydrolase family protein [Glycomyces luteolus]
MNERPAPLTVAAAQPELRPGDLAFNAPVHAEAIRAAGARLVVFPELSLSSYVLAAPAVALDDPALDAIVAACAETGAVALAGAPLKEGDAECIAMLRFDGGGVEVAYRKMHPDEEESRRFRAAADPAVLELDGWRLGLAICRDSMMFEHAPAVAEFAKRSGIGGIDAYVAGSLFTSKGLVRRDKRMPQLARGYGMWVVQACFAGPGTDLETTGNSAVWAPDGSVAARADERPGRIVKAELRF